MNSQISPSQKSLSLRKLLSDFITLEEQWDVPIYGVAHDSRQVQKGDAFFACRGHVTDGYRYIDEAVSRGAAAIIANTNPANGLLKGCSYFKAQNDANNKIPLIAIDDLQGKLGILAARFYQQPSERMTVIGVTGTNGKTSTSQFIAGALSILGQRCGVVGTLGYGLYNQLNTQSLTTPDALSLQKLFNNFIAQGAQTVAMEVSSHALAQKRVNGIQFSIAVFTNLTRDHLDFHGDMKQYAEAKRKLFRMPGLKQVVINADDEVGKELLIETHKYMPVVAYSIEDRTFLPTDIPLVQAKNIQLHSNGIEATIYSPWGRGQLQSTLLGRFNLSNLLAALSVLSMMGIDFNEALDAVNKLRGVAGRLQVKICKNGVLAVIDYAHTPDALQQALKALREHCSAHLWCVFGCGGDRDRGKRPLMAKIAQRFADDVVITSDNPRHEDPSAIISNIVEGLSHLDNVHVEVDRRKAIDYALRTANQGDVVLIAGKGHETYQQIGDEKFSFDDAKEVERISALL